MAIGEKLFNEEGILIYPISDASVINSEALTPGGNVEACLKDIYEKLTDISEEGDAAKNINVTVGYLLLDNKEEAFAKEQTGWGAFDFPTAEQPYLWKRTSYNYDELELTTTYEIVLMYPENETETVYKAYVDPDKEQPEILYEENNGVLDYNKPLLSELGWSYDPISISAEKPYVYMATRKRTDGKWEAFSTPALLAKWTFDSIITIKYAITSDSTPPELASGEINPGDAWFDNNSTEFTGYLWMITATSVNKVLYKQDDIIWNGPNLLSIVK